MLVWTIAEPATRDEAHEDVADLLLQGIDAPRRPVSRPPRRSSLGQALTRLSEGPSAAPAGSETLIDAQPENLVSEAILGAERRVHPRHDSEADVWVSLRPPHLQASLNSSGASAGRIRGRIVDVSMGGFALRLAEPVTAGQRIWMSIANPFSAKPLETEGSVLRCTPQPSGDWHVICQLSRRLTFEQVHQVGKQLFASALV